MNWKVLSLPSVSIAIGLAASSASAFSFSLTPVTYTSSNNASPIFVNGTVTVGAGETFYSPNVMSTTALPFTSGFTAGFNGTGQNWHPAFLAWNGIGTYTGPIHVFQISPTNFGYSGGMPQGLYNKNPLGPGGFSALTLNYAGVNGATGGVAAQYALQVVPEPTSILAITMGLLVVARRRANKR